MVTAGAQWFKPSSLQQLYDVLGQHKDSKYRLMFGGTGSGNHGLQAT